MLLTRKLYLQDQVRFDSGLWQTAGTETLVLPQGSYEMVLHGAGGAGGQSGTTYEDYSGGSGGAGGVGHREVFFVRLARPTVVGLYVGAKGLTVANGGNGGAKGAWTDSGESGAGGGGGKPTYVKFAAQALTQNYYGWKYAPVNSGIYVGATKTFYVTSNDRSTFYISETQMAYTLFSFQLVKGTHYANGEQLFYMSEQAFTIIIQINISNGVVQLTGTNSGTISIIPTDISNEFIGGEVLTQTLTPVVGDGVFSNGQSYLGQITEVGDGTFVFENNTCTRYSVADMVVASTTNSDVQVKTYCAWVAPGGTIMYTKPNAELTAGSTVRIYAAGELDSSISAGLLGNVNEEGTGFTFEGNAYSRNEENDVYDVSSVYLYALGGGGGGGGGAPGRISYRADGGSGGGGGGYYRFTGDISEPFISVPGKQGSKGGTYSSSSHTYANAGTTGNTIDFPGVYSGNGARSSTNSSGVNGAYGGGASGAGGREGASAEHSSISSGAGGGGAGGDLDAGGGKAGTGYFSGATAGYNHHTTPTATKDHLGNTQTSGWGVGGGVNANGSDGWLYIKRIS